MVLPPPFTEEDLGSKSDERLLLTASIFFYQKEPQPTTPLASIIHATSTDFGGDSSNVRLTRCPKPQPLHSSDADSLIGVQQHLTTASSDAEPPAPSTQTPDGNASVPLDTPPRAQTAADPAAGGAETNTIASSTLAVGPSAHVLAAHSKVVTEAGTPRPPPSVGSNRLSKEPVKPPHVSVAGTKSRTIAVDKPLVEPRPQEDGVNKRVADPASSEQAAELREDNVSPPPLSDGGASRDGSSLRRKSPANTKRSRGMWKKIAANVSVRVFPFAGRGMITVINDNVSSFPTG